jgi:magnesium chelatase subunit D
VSVGYPLSAIVGQEELIEALLINAVAPDVGGVLVRGQRGTAKSTAVRGLAPLLPPVGVAEGQSYAFAPGEIAPEGEVPADAHLHERAAPLVELPLGATLDRLVGALDLGRALDGHAAFEPGLLARAHRGILYVDEVNLLPDHLVDALLDAAASGVARVEREAVSVEHAARFLLVGTMNVEEGELRPQLLDRFGLGVDVGTPSDPAVRAEIVRRRLAFERDPRGFAGIWQERERELAARIAAARARLEAIHLPERELLRITGACARLGVDGVRGDTVCARAARALAALDGPLCTRPPPAALADRGRSVALPLDR